MDLIQKLSVRSGMAVFTLAALLSMGVVAAIGVLAIEAEDQVAARLQRDVGWVRAIGLADMMHDAIRADTLSARLAGADADGAERRSLHDEFTGHADAIVKALGQVVVEGDTSLRSAIEQARADVDSYVGNARQVIDQALAGRADEARLKAFEQGFERLEKSLEALGDRIEAASAESARERDLVHRRALLSMAAAIVSCGVVFGALALAFTRSTLRRLGAEPTALRELSLRIADGELVNRLPVEPAGGSVAASMLRMQQMLADSVRQIRRNAEAVAAASSQIAEGNHDLSTRTELQAGTLQQTATSMDTLSTTVNQNAGHAGKARALATDACSVAETGGTVVGQVVQTMQAINESSRRIADILSIIDGIAFRTNILALNAAVEAARAGEQGRGFAVVASEVRSLAGRSADASREIKALIEASVDRVEAGCELADRAGTTMREVVESIRRVTDVVAEISAASEHQSSGVTQVSQAVNEMDHATQQNAALVEQSAAAASSLREQARQLVDAVAVFRLSASPSA